MNEFFLEFLNMSLKASYVILAVIIVRFLLKKAPKKYSYALWAVAAFRLVCPVSFQSVISLFALKIEKNNTTHVDLTQVVSPTINTIQPQANIGLPPVDTAINNSLPAPTPQYSANPMQKLVYVAAFIWLVGIAALLIYGVVSYIRLHRKLRFAVKLEDNIYQTEAVSSPFIMGFVRPKIYIPYGLDPSSLEYVLAHEKAHIKRLDHLVKPISFLVLTVHWFNPLVWLSFYLMSRDMEMSCDEKVLVKGAPSKDYSTTLLNLAVKKRFPSPSPLAFGESGVKGRIKNALKFKKPALWITVIAVIICIAVIFICAADPKENEKTTADDIFGHVYSVPEIICKDGNISYDIDIYETGYYIDEDGVIYYKGWTEEEPWHEFGKLERFELTKENFDDYFVSDEIWKDGYSAKKLREDNKTAWKLEQHDNPFYILQQKNGELFCVSIAPDSNKDANAYDSFILRLDSNDDVFKQAYSVPEVIYIDGKYSLMPVTDDTACYYIDEIGTVHQKGWTAEESWNELGTLESVHLTKSNFDDYFSKGSMEWSDGYSIKKLRDENNAAWKFEYSNNLYYVLQQENGELFYVVIPTHPGAGSGSGNGEGVTDEFCVRWIFRMQPVGNGDTEYILSGDSYVSYQCLYMNPLSSFAAVGGDSGYRYVFVIDEELAYCSGFVRIDRKTGDMMSFDYSDWGVFPYSEEEWNDMCMLYPVDISGYLTKEWMQLNGSCALAMMDSQHLWFVEMRTDKEGNDYIWSIYSLVPEEYMGSAEWDYSAGETMKIDFNIPGNMTAVCTQSDISTDGVSFDVGADWSDGSLYWSPLNDSGEPVLSAQIHYSSDTGYAGTLYIVGSFAGDGMHYTVETSGTGLHIENAEDGTVRISVKDDIFAFDTDLVSVPNVVGLAFKEAVRKLQSNDLGYEIEYVDSEEPLDVVISQSYDEGDFVPKRTVVVLQVSAGMRDPIDYTVDNTGEDFFRYEDIEGRTMGMYRDRTNAHDRGYSFRAPKNVSECSQIIVVGEIYDMYYADGGSVYTLGQAATVYDFKIEQVLRGDYVPGDLISISQDSGYYRWYVQEPKVLEWAAEGNPKYVGTPEVGIVTSYGGIPEMQVGEKYVMFLHVPNWERYKMSYVEGTFSSVGNWTGIYKINDDGTVSRYIDAERTWTYGTLEELIQEVKENPYDEDKFYDIFIDVPVYD